MEFSDFLFGLEGVLSVLNFLPLAIAVMTYVLTGMGLYTMAKRRMINHPWLSWVPVGNLWILGSLSDQYRYVTKGQVKSKRKILLWLTVATIAVSLISTVLMLVRGVGLITDTVLGVAGETEIFTAVFSSMMRALGMLVLTAPIFIAAMVVRYMALYDLYMSCDPENAVLFLVLSIVFSVTEPFFIYCSRNNEKGMPPRRPRPEQIPSYEIPGEAPQARPSESRPEQPEDQELNAPAEEAAPAPEAAVPDTDAEGAEAPEV